MIEKPNADVKRYAKEHNVRLWQVAEYLGMSDGMLSKRFRHELSLEEKEEIYEAIKTIAAEG